MLNKLYFELDKNQDGKITEDEFLSAILAEDKLFVVSPLLSVSSPFYW